MSTIGSSSFGIVSAGCRCLPSAPAGKLSFDRGLHIFAIAEVIVGGGARGWLLTIDETLSPDAVFSYIPQVSALAPNAPNGDTPPTALAVPYVHRTTPDVGGRQRYIVYLRTVDQGDGIASPWPAYGSLRSTVPPENPAPIAPGADIAFAFPETLEGGVVQSGPGGLSLPVAGRWLIEAEITIAGAGQVVVAFGGAEVPGTVVGRESVSATGPDDVDTQIVMSTVIDTGAPGIVTLRNPAANAAYTLTPNAGGAGPTHATFRATLLPVPGAPSPSPIQFVDPLVALVGSEGFSFSLVQSGLDSGTAP